MRMSKLTFFYLAFFQVKPILGLNIRFAETSKSCVSLSLTAFSRALPIDEAAAE